MQPVAVILAAGEPRKMAHPKALLEHEGGKSFLQSLASSFGKAGCAVLAVIGHEAEQVRAQHPAVHLVEAERWRESPLASAQAGIRAALEEGADLVLLHPVDMPALRSSTLKTLVKAGTDVDLTRPEFENMLGWPVVIGRRTAQRVLESRGQTLDEALQGVDVKRVPTKDPGVVVNLNAPDVYQRLFDSEPKLAPPPKKRAKKAPAA